MPGWIRLHRDIQDHWLYQQKRKFSEYEAWTSILLRVNHTEAKVLHNGTLETVERGSTIWSMGDMEKEWGWSNTKVKRFLERLKNDEMVTYKSTTKKTYLTVVNYGKYQGDDEEKTPPKHHENTTETFQKHTNNNELIMTKNEKKKKPRQLHDEGSTNYKMAKYLFDKVMERAAANNTIHLIEKADLQKWADDCRMILEVDKRDKNETRQMIDWAVKDSFWCTNMLSPTSLRKHYVKIAVAMRSTPNIPTQDKTQTSYDKKFENRRKQRELEEQERAAHLI